MLRTIIKFISASLAAVMTGCSTILTTPMSMVSEGEELPGTRIYEMHVGNLTVTSRGPNDFVALVPSEIYRHFKVSQYKEQWDIVYRYRSVYIAGIDEEYSIGKDLFHDPILGAYSLLILTPIVTIGALFSPDMREECPYLMGAFAGLLPFINIKHGFYGSETVKRNKTKIKLQSIDKKESVSSDQLNGRYIKWKVYCESNGYIMKAGKMSWPHPIELPLCEWALDNYSIPTLKIELSGDNILLGGTTTWSLSCETNMHVAAGRRWPDSESRPAFQSEVRFIRWLDPAGNQLRVLKSGQKGTMEIQLRNPPRSTSSYMLKIQNANGGSEAFVSWAEAPSVKYLPGNTTTNLNIPFRIPAQLPDGESAIDLVAVDIFGRTTSPCHVQMPLRQAEFPELGVYTAVVRSKANGHELVLDVRNRGKGEANQVVVALEQTPAGIAFWGRQQNISLIPPYSRREVVFPLVRSIPAGTTELALRVRISEELELPPMIADIKAVVMSAP